MSPSLSEAKSLRSSDLGGGIEKNGSSSARADPGRIDHALGGDAALGIEALVQDAEHEVVEQRVAGPGVAGDQGVAVDIGDVGDPADINHDDRPLALQRLRQRAVIDRHERRALPAGLDVGGAEIMHDRDMDRLGQRRGVADLHRQPALGPVQHGLAVEADDIDVLEGDAVLGDKGGHRLGMGRCDDLLGLAQAARPGIALRQVDRLVQRLAQQVRAPLRYKAGIRTARRPLTRRPSVSIKATSTPSSEVPLIRPIAVNIICHVPSQRPARSVPPTTTSLCQTHTSYNATAARLRQPVPLWFRDLLQLP